MEDLHKLTDIQLNWLQARLRCKSDKEACVVVGIAPSTCYGWEEKQFMNKLLQEMRLKDIEITRERLGRLGGKAVDALENELDDIESKQKVYAAVSVLDRIGLSAKQQIDVTSGGESIVLTAEERVLRIQALMKK
jgi:hypothetical protein